MNILDCVGIILIISSVAICVFKGFKKIIFKLAAFAIAMVLAKFIGQSFGNLLLSDFIKFDIGSVSDKVNNTIISILGTLIVFVLLFVFLKLIFKVVEGKFEKNIQSVIVDRLCGALVGFVLGVAVVFVFTEIVSIVLAIVATIKRDASVFKIADNSMIFRLVRNLN